VLRVRAAFAVLAAFGGSGVLAYGLLWAFVPLDRSQDRGVSPAERNQGLALLLLGIGLVVAFGFAGGLPIWLLWPLAVAIAGAAVVWREADETRRHRLRAGAGALASSGGRGATVRVLAGVALVVGSFVALLASNASASDLRFALVAVLAALLGAGLLTLPWWVRMVRELNAERADRIRSQERAEIAAHLHDSVLQTLALIQKQADASRQVRRLARGQERELREWLYGPRGYGRTGAEAEAVDEAPQSTSALAVELPRLCGEVEDDFAIEVEHVVVGDCEVGQRQQALLAAIKEALVNAAKHAGVREVSVFVEVEPERVSAYVRDRGAGFDPNAVGADRHGLADSIRARVERNGGGVAVRSDPGNGTEVRMEVPRTDPG
jgi:signal transduction histidine kinase